MSFSDLFNGKVGQRQKPNRASFAEFSRPVETYATQAKPSLAQSVSSLMAQKWERAAPDRTGSITMDTRGIEEMIDPVEDGTEDESNDMIDKQLVLQMLQAKPELVLAVVQEFLNRG